MSYSSEHRRLPLSWLSPPWILPPILSRALFEALTAGFNIWCTPEDHHKVGMRSAHRRRVASVRVRGHGNLEVGRRQIVAISWKPMLRSGTNVGGLRRRTSGTGLASTTAEDLEWAEAKVRWLFQQRFPACIF